MSVLSRAVAYWKASDYSGSGALLDGSGNGHDAQQGSTPGADTNDPLFLDYDDEKHVYFPGTANDNWTTPDQPQFNIPDNFKVRIRCTASSYNTDGVMVVMGTGGGNHGYEFMFWFTNIRLSYNTTGAFPGWVHAVSDAHDVSPGTPHWFEAEFIDGDVTFREGATEETISEINTVDNASATVTLAATGVEVAKKRNWGDDSHDLRVYEVKIYDNGSLVYHAVSDDASEPYATFTERSAYAETVTINRSATGKKAEVVNQKLFLGGTDDRMEVADHADLDFAADESFTIVYAGRTYDPTPAADQVLIAKKADLATGVGYALYIDTTGTVNALIADGTNSSEDTIAGLAAGETFVVALRRDVGADELEVFLDGVGSGSPTTDATTATLANALDLFIGSISGGGSYLDGSKFGAAVFAEALSDADIASAGSELLVTTVVLSAALASFAAPATSTQPGAVTKALQPAVGSFSAPATSTQPGTITAVLSPAVATFAAPAVTVTNVICELAVFSNFSLSFPTFSSVSLSFPELTSVTVEF